MARMYFADFKKPRKSVNKPLTFVKKTKKDLRDAGLSEDVDLALKGFSFVLGSHVSNYDLFKHLTDSDKVLYKEHLEKVSQSVFSMGFDKRHAELLSKVVLNYKAGLGYLDDMLDFMRQYFCNLQGMRVARFTNLLQRAVDGFWGYGLQMSILEELRLRADRHSFYPDEDDEYIDLTPYRDIEYFYKYPRPRL